MNPNPGRSGACPDCGAYRADGRPPYLHYRGCRYEDEPPQIGRWLRETALGDPHHGPAVTATSPRCRHPLCGQPVEPCGCFPFLGWRHSADPDHALAAHCCPAYGPAHGTPGRIAEPEPSIADTVARVIGALGRLPRAAAHELDTNKKVTPAAVDARAAGVTCCVFCMLPADVALGLYAVELMVDGTRWLDLCAPHGHDVRLALDPADGAGPDVVIAEWERQRGRQAAV